ncbi:MAG: hypothetical protein KAH56_01950 [Candidatus Krumholzibacteria bacterium]|nr:hypothetical protein [Candidatus Krumholzibacteria bacterium]
MKIFLFLLMLLALCPSVYAQEAGWVLTSDYSTFGRVRSFTLDDPWSVSGDLATIPGDPTGRYHDGKVYIVGRGGASLIQIYDPEAGFTLVREFSIGASRNPQDIAFDSAGDAYVSCYDEAVLLRVDVADGAILDTFDTSMFADADGLPETAWMLARGDLLYIANQKLDRNNWYAPTGPGDLLVFDMVAETWVDMDSDATGIQPIVLTGADPYTRIEAVELGVGEWNLRVGCVGSYGVNDGGIEDVDPIAGVSLGYVVTEQELGGDISAFTSTGDDLHVLVSDTSFITSLRRFSPASGSVTVLDTGNGYVHADLAWDGDFQLYLADRTVGASGLRVFDTVSGTELTSGTLATGLPPFKFILPTTDGVSAVPVAYADRLRLSPPYPNPCNPAADLQIQGQPGHLIRVGVFDLRGRRMQDRTLEIDSNGRTVFRFDGRDRQGRSLPAGVYRVVVQDQTGFAARTLTLLK